MQHIVFKAASDFIKYDNSNRVYEGTLMAKTQLKPLAMALGATLAASVATNVMAAENPFSSQALESGYKVMAEGKCGEGKCGEGKAKKSEGKCGEGKCGEGKAKKAEGKCGEGKCGEGKAKKSEGKCGEGKCGGKS